MKKIFSVLLLLFILTGLCSCQSVPTPAITQAEFPFEIVYEKGGEITTASEVYVCEFEGIEWNENVGKHRQWKGYVKSTGASTLVLYEEGNVKLTCSLGSPAYYMSDPLAPAVDEIIPTIQRVETLASGGVSAMTLSAEQLSEQYDSRLISWAFSAPIENTYE